MKKILIFLALSFLFITVDEVASNDKKPFTFDDVMKFKSIRYPKISDNGDWISYVAVPDRGDATAYYHDLNDTSNVKIIERGISPIISSNSKWGASIVKPKEIDLENAKKEKPNNSFELISLNSDRKFIYDEVSKFEFSNDSKWTAIVKKGDKAEYKADKVKKKPNGSDLILKHLNSGTDIIMNYVTEFKFDSLSKFLFYVISDPNGRNDGIYFRALNEEFAPEYVVDTSSNSSYGNIEWNQDSLLLAYTSGKLSSNGEPDSLNAKIWNMNNKSSEIFLSATSIKDGWYLPYKNKLSWTEDGARLFLGLKPWTEKDTTDEDKFKYTDSSFFDIETILTQKDLLVWHWNDDRITPNQIKWWQENKDRTFLSVYHLDSKEFVQLADENLEYVMAAENPEYTVAIQSKPYLKLMTWDGWYHDLYSVNLKTGERNLIEQKISENGYISPLGKFVAFFKDSAWYVYDNNTKESTDLTTRIGVNFYNEENDVPQNAGSYGFVGWYSKDEGFIVYDQYDIWALGTNKVSFNNLTFVDGRQGKKRIRVVNLDRDKKHYSNEDTVYTVSYHKNQRHQSLSRTEISIAGSEELINNKGKKLNWRGKAKNQNVFIFTQESFDEFPDIWVSYSADFDTLKKITSVNPQMKDYKWGYSEPYEFVTKNQDTLKSYIVKPDDFDPNKKYPLLVYFYEQFAEYTYEFYQPRMNHRPNYQTYLSDGYLIIVPDIKYYTGRPGYDATDALVAATQKIIDQGFVKEDKIVIQGHSWGAYQGAFVITQTDMFAASCVGAPVGNMTSAYSGIRHGTGLARQFQYEKYQSRIGGNLWDSLDNYLNNSPVILADKINTPLLILHGDIDEAVPWEQGIELFLALRRLERPAWFLQYKGEPHHPRKYPNKVDWAVKMKEFFDYYALDKPAPKWMTEGEPWWGK